MTGDDHKRVFSSAAETYDTWYKNRKGARFDWLEKRTVRGLMKNIQPFGSLLEFGSGTGWWSQFFGDLGFQVTGIECAAAMIERARKKKIPGVRFKKADALNTGFADGSFFITAAITAMEFSRDPGEMVREMARITRPGGYMILGVLNRDAPINQARTKKKNSLFATARFFNRGELLSLLQPFGTCKIIPCGFPLSLRCPRFLAGVCDDLMAWCGRKTGAFLAARVRVMKGF